MRLGRGIARAAVGVLLVVAGETDQLVRPEITAEFVAHERALGTDVHVERIPGTGHGLVAERALRTLLPWLASVDAGAGRD